MPRLLFTLIAVFGGLCAVGILLMLITGKRDDFALAGLFAVVEASAVVLLTPLTWRVVAGRGPRTLGKWLLGVAVCVGVGLAVVIVFFAACVGIALSREGAS